MTLNIHVYNTAFTHETRMLKITRWLAEQHLFDRVEVAALWKDGLAREESLDAVRHVVRLPIDRGRKLPSIAGKLGGFAEWYIRILGRYRKQKIALINAHSLVALPICTLLKWLTGAKLIYDTHELETGTAESGPVRQLFGRLIERACMPWVDATGAVGDSIAHWYKRQYGLQQVHVVKNYPPRRMGPPHRSPVLRNAFNLPEDALVFIYHGIISETRGARVIVEAFKKAPTNCHVVFMGFGQDEDYVRDAARQQPNIHFHPAVKPSEVHDYVCGADVGIYVLQNTCLNNYFICPNKVFDYLNAGLAAIVSDFPDIAAEVHAVEGGWCIQPRADDLSQLLNQMDRDMVETARAGAAHWAEKNGWETQLAPLAALYREAGFEPAG